MSDQQPDLPNRQIPFSEAFKQFIADGWAAYPSDLPEPLPAASAAARRRELVSDRFPGERLVIGAGGLKTRSNDTDFRFRPHSAFAYLTGLGTDCEPDAVLVMEPSDAGHAATLYFKPRAPRDDREFYADSRFGELWVGRRPTLDEMSALCGISCAAIDDLADQLRKDADTTPLRVLPVDLDEAVAALIDEVRSIVTTGTEELSPDAELAQVLSELRLVKDEFEIAELREACRQTIDAFIAVVAELPEAVRRGRGERWIEGTFGRHARHVGNAVGYDTIAAAGEHACTLHWIRNDGEVREGELLLLDAGVELDSLYTADITRTLPISGTVQRGTAQGLRRRVRRPAGGHRGGPAGCCVPRRAPRGDRGDRRAPGGVGAAAGQPGGVAQATRAASTGAGWCTAPRTTSASTCTTAPWPAGSTTGRERWSRAW